MQVDGQKVKKMQFLEFFIGPLCQKINFDGFQYIQTLQKLAQNSTFWEVAVVFWTLK